MAFADTFLPEFDNEMRTTRSLLERVPLDNARWKPHTKSTDLGKLATHLANLAGFGHMIATKVENDFATPETQARMAADYTTADELLSNFDKNAAASRDAIAKLADQDLGTTWTLRNGEHVILAVPRATALRVLMMNHIIHHRGQLSVYLRLNDVPLPSIYGPTADM